MSQLIEKFRRVSSRGSYVPEVDGLRFIAIFLVVAVHILGNMEDKIDGFASSSGDLGRLLKITVERGGWGVSLFFAISGFILALPFAKHHLKGGPRIQLGRYFKRRLTRIEPPYVVASLAFFVLLPYFGKFSYADGFPHLLATLAYCHNIIYSYRSTINDNFWSLEIEVQFYILVPFLTALFRYGKQARRLMFIGSFSFGIFLNWVSPDYPQALHRELHFFLVGFLLADLYISDSKLFSKSKLLRWDFFALSAFAVMVFLNHSSENTILTELVDGVSIFIVFIAAFRGRYFNVSMRVPLLTAIGGMCYSIYLIHMKIISLALAKIYTKSCLTGIYLFDYFVASLVICGMILLFSGIFFLIIEKPCMKESWPSDLNNWIVSGQQNPSMQIQ